MPLNRLPLIALYAIVLSAQGSRGPEFNAARLRTGTFVYRTLVDGKEAGQSKIRIRPTDGGTYTFSNSVGGAFAQSWEAIAKADMSPISARLIFGEGEQAKPSFELKYSGGRVTGFSKARSVDDPVVAGTVDQRIDWAAVMAMRDYQAGAESMFHVYDPGTGNSRVDVRTGSTEIVEVPAGKFEAVRVVYRIAKNKGTEEYRVFLRQAVPRMMVKENFPNGAVTELVRVEP